ncbi:MAG: Vitamin B12 dependent methionine synthase activation subunit [Clostridia bacterium]|nr:Vitamin B12 dependent methionine synthase activation subunit [Clostridia bacterium]
MEKSVCLRAYDAPPISRKEILRYAGMPKETPQISALLDECLAEISKQLSYRVCYRELPITLDNGMLHLGFADSDSSDLQKNLAECSSIVLFAATVGLAPDRLVARYTPISPTKALLMQAIGAERIEALCDLFSQEISAEKSLAGFKTRPRFSPGYGDLSLDLQKSIVLTLDCQRKIGLALNESLLLTPTKSVTAIIGVTRK